MYQSANQLITEIEAKKMHHASLDAFKHVMAEIGNPQNDFKSIHIAGTNGKGSTTDYIRSILQSAGYKVATFTSPYLIVHNDRIRINNQNISDENLVDIANRYEHFFDELSMFEIDMLIACVYFSEQQVDYGIIEVGMGGRLDATNILFPQLSVITNIGLDHMEYLGDTVELIAHEKAGIIKESVDCITASKDETCIKVFEKECQIKNSHLIQISPITNIHLNEEVSFDYQGQHYQLSSLATYQCDNAACAIEVCKRLNVESSAIHEGLYNTLWKGRFECVSKHPRVYIDGAHNVAGIDALVESAIFLNDPIIIFSALKDKKSDLMIEKLLELSKDLIVCEFDFYRAQSAKLLAKQYPVIVMNDYQAAIQWALAQQRDVLICGSLYFISLVRKLFA